MSLTAGSPAASDSTGQNPQKTIIVGVSGPSSSGKTTLARLLRAIFNPEDSECPASGSCAVKSFILHEDDFYKSDDQIPVTTTQSGKLVEDWDTIDALNVPQLSSTLTYIKRNGVLPTNLKSKEDLNEAANSGVENATVEQFRKQVAERLDKLLRRQQQGRETRSNEGDPPKDGDKSNDDTIQKSDRFLFSVAFVDGFLLYAPPGNTEHSLASVHQKIDVPLFLPATYTLLKERREGRTGYVTIGPAPTPEVKSESDNTGNDLRKEGLKEQDDNASEGGYDPPEQNFWTDPPGYVDDIVWPRYIAEHSWLLVPDPESSRTFDELKEAVGEGEDVSRDAGVIVAPGKGKAPIIDLLGWAVEEVMAQIERTPPGHPSG